MERQQCFRAKILNEYEITYLFCQSCGFLQTEEPYWLDKAYSSAIADSDTGLASRNIHISKQLASLLYFLFDKDGKYLDIAGGYGLLTRLMRDIGFDFYWSDLYCENIFARGFELTSASQSFSAITAFEALEHIYDPLSFIKKSLKQAKTSTIVFSTQLFNGSPPKPGWWYYTPETGQHISFFQRSTLDFLANQLSLNIYSYSNLHILTDKKINSALFRILIGRLSSLLYPYVKKRMNSKTFLDREKISLIISEGVKNENCV
ncbi:MAG: class I SAM-dependent methyltransferase [Prochloraceae cyanobacterium]|nr:class I SAM-dependent methyltransferase [Prochloraceae cyanobacterium]